MEIDITPEQEEFLLRSPEEFRPKNVDRKEISPIKGLDAAEVGFKPDLIWEDFSSSHTEMTDSSDELFDIDNSIK